MRTQHPARKGSSIKWLTIYPPEDDPYYHVVPDFGPEHDYIVNCWCHPVLDAGTIIHNVAQ